VIVTDEAALRVPSEPVKDLSEGGEVARRLTYALQKHNKKASKDAKRGRTTETVVGVGLAAPQIGIHKRVVVVMLDGVPTVLMNPVIVEWSSETIPFTEGCLSFPGVQVETTRHLWVVVEAMNHRGPLVFGPRDEPWSDSSVLKSVVVQHEIAHLDGQLFVDFARKDSDDSHPDPGPM
jgi:peptide deformylase